MHRLVMSLAAVPPDPSSLALPVVIACLTCLALLEFARCIRAAERELAGLCWAAGAFAAGTGLWATHFLAMNARAFPIPVGYTPLMTFVSWLCGVGGAGLVLSLAREPARSTTRAVGRAVVFGVLVCFVHFTAVAAVELAPGIEWDFARVATGFSCALAFALGTSLAANPRRVVRAGPHAVVARLVLGVALGVALCGFDVVALSAIHVPDGAICFSLADFDGARLATLVTTGAPVVLCSVLLSSIVYGVVDRRRTQLSGSLEHVAAELDVANGELRQRAMLDPLTGLPTRVLFEDRLAQALLRADRARKSVRGIREKLAVLFIDIDGFKPINDSFGHAIGDDVIRQLAERVRAEARDGDTVSRIGADQFVVLMEGAASSDDGVALAMRILDAMREEMTIGERRIQISVSIGIVIYPDNGDRSRLLTQADAAMQAAKRAGRGTYAVFASHMHRDIVDQLDLVNDLRQAIELGQLQLHYQPKIDGRRHRICGVEALLRWHHPERGTVAPAVFIPLAERFGIINALGGWVIEEACRQMEAWSRAGVRMRVAINLSVHQLREPDLVARVQDALNQYGVEPSHLLCEITESVAMQDIAAMQRTLDALGAIGVYLSIDDFGTGYSSLSYLRQLPARQLKIDRSFINDVDSSEDAKAVVDGVVRLAHALGLRVVAEGVETATQRDILLGLNCDELQGYFFARPMTAEKLLAWTHGNKPADSLDFAQSLVRRTIAA